MPDVSTPRASVVIPAHNEGRHIRGCLHPLLTLSSSLPLEIIVVANGCQDDTVAVARQVPGVHVLDLPEPGKTGALNAGDEAATTFPRIYLDADVELDQQALRSMIAALDTDQPRLAAPSVRYDTQGADLWVRAYYRVFRQLPSARETTVGRGVYAVSKAGRARFQQFPDVLGDDLFVNRLFTSEERVVCEGWSTVRTPRRWRDLVRVRARLAAGNAQLARTNPEEVGALAQSQDFSRTTSSTLRALLRLVASRPQELPSAAVYVGITTLARSNRRMTGRWHRDESSR
ncbi:glycosyltransferase [Ornithinimicrobium sufpigmenti]|uniref:glycosyltransferase n=1 Tax=Ornithinimicrobium sufpigmenti TaxID=2508882 RepID=UPI001035E15E|nr:MULTISPECIES: glycosyltransferase family 2 protein [unclassified Ornithinimicrobium]